MPEEEQREKLSRVIRQWNNNRLDLFEITAPDQNFEFHGVMRFYLEDGVSGNVATKCLRVSSSWKTLEVIDTLSEKFRPDMKMLTTSYSLFEIHANKERKLELDDSPLVVQLNWNRDNREGRFVLKKDRKSLEEKSLEKEKGGVMQSFKRTLSRKDKKKDKNRNKETEEKRSTENLLNNNSIYVSDYETKKSGGLGGKHKDNPHLSDDPALPIGVTFSESSEHGFLSAVINYTNSSTVHFHLSPAFILYAAARSALKTQRATEITNKMAAMTGRVIQRQQGIAGALSFWMANTSELLNFLKHDKDLGPITEQSQLNLSHLVHTAYSGLLQCLQSELKKHLPTFLIDPEQHGALPAGIELVLNTLMNGMSLLRRCRVNPALTIQLFSQLFHFISCWLFNQLMVPEPGAPGLRSHYWGAALRQRLSAIEGWAERQGLELAADCHLGHILQATTLLTMNKYSLQDVKVVVNSCFRLNSLQLHTLLSGYLYANNEPHIPPEVVEAVVLLSGSTADQLILSEGREVFLQESLDLQLPFLLPEGGYSCSSITGTPAGLRDFLEPICRKGLCCLTSQPNSRGDWTVFFRETDSSEESTFMAVHREPEVETITLKKPLNSGMGVSIVAAKGAGRANLGIYIKSIVKGGPAEMNGRLTAGDQLLSVDGHSLVGLSQERAAAIMMHTGPVVALQVEKSAARLHGLEALLTDTQRNTGDQSQAKPMSGETVLLQGGNRRRREQLMQKNRQLFRSNPNMTDFSPEDEAVVRGNNMAAVSSVNLCAADAYHREYLTLPTPKSSQEKKRSDSALQTFTVSLKPAESSRTCMRQALSQENLCVDRDRESDRQRPLLDGRQAALRNLPSFPLRSCVSTDLLSERQQGVRSSSSSAGVWRNPFPQNPFPQNPFPQNQTPTPSSQPVRIDIPLPRTVSSRPPLTSFLQGSRVRVSDGSLQRPSSNKPQVSIPPTKHVSFQDPPAWKREAQEKHASQQLMQQQVQDLQGKERRMAEESARLTRLSVEAQFQKRLQEREEEDEEEEEEEEEEEMMLTLQQLERRAQSKQLSAVTAELKESAGSRLAQKEHKTKTEQKSASSRDVDNVAAKQ
ncbi:LOW QUALITY PROTEIN: afadin-like [Trematomus bernacchii]|uniref:LOW QUALITY PROTEIN: afadin-like n=1 Tax=Trematomus bernacchii TaxID=40690 RepID=UPI00146C5A47|nr:LOW QUALITY PROTEIN: afadin-like [Trematomus bernacchii]